MFDAIGSFVSTKERLGGYLKVTKPHNNTIPGGCLGDLLGDEILPSFVGIIINHELRIPINQPRIHGKYPAGIFPF